MKAIPYEDDDSCPNVRRHDLPHNAEELKYDIRNIKYREQPIVTISNKIEILAHAGNTRISAYFFRKQRRNFSDRMHTQHLTDQGKQEDLHNN